MPDLIYQLPDSVANQIAAGEVIQRPASVVKELVENAVDAGATEIKVLIKEGGTALIQVIDNGQGMSPTDARMAFERHATSKLKQIDDIFALATFGFRGEALASIAAVAQVELKTRREEDELGTRIVIHGSQVLTQEPVSCPRGSNFAIRNLFFNIPARRRFLKAPNAEFNHVEEEFQRVALTREDIHFELHKDDKPVLVLPAETLKGRVVSLFNKNLSKSLIPVNIETSIVRLRGFVGTPESARRRGVLQFFFTNGRYMRKPFFHKAVVSAYEKILPTDYQPLYFLWLEVDPNMIDVNIHPSKTEIKFEEANSIYQIIHATAREALGKFNFVPGMDFDTKGRDEQQYYLGAENIHVPMVEIDPGFDPFASGFSGNNTQSRKSGQQVQQSDYNNKEWQLLIAGFEAHTSTGQNSLLSSGLSSTGSDYAGDFLQIKNKYILMPVSAGLMVIHQRRAHERILYEEYTHGDMAGVLVSQKQLYPSAVELSSLHYNLLCAMMDDLNQCGFDLVASGGNSVIVNALPACFIGEEPGELLLDFLDLYRTTVDPANNKIKEHAARSLAKVFALKSGKAMAQEEMRELAGRLLACREPAFSPDGKKVYIVIEHDELDKRF